MRTIIISILGFGLGFLLRSILDDKDTVITKIKNLINRG